MDELPPNLDLDEEAMQKYYGIFFRARDLVEQAVATGAIAGRDVLLEVSVAQAAIWGIVSLFKGKRIHPEFWDSMDPMIDRFIELSFEAKEKKDDTNREDRAAGRDPARAGCHHLAQVARHGARGSCATRRNHQGRSGAAPASWRVDVERRRTRLGIAGCDAAAWR